MAERQSPILRRFPALAKLPRVSLGNFPTPVDRVTLGDGRPLWIKRDDKSGPGLGGNKVRALEWLLGEVRPADAVLTVGPTGSTHALATSRYARQLGAAPIVVRWNQRMNPAARAVDERLHARGVRLVDMGNVVAAYAVAMWLRVRSRAHWVPAGGTNALGVLGYVNGAMELAEQIERGECPAPTDVVVPLGTGGTAAGIALGLHLAGIDCRVRAVRVAPRIIASHARVAWLIQRARSLIEAITHERVSSPRSDSIVVENDFYGGGYGHAIPPSPPETGLASLGIRLDDTYSRKSFAAAARHAGEATLFWLTFDGRLLEEGGRRKEDGAEKLPSSTFHLPPSS